MHNRKKILVVGYNIKGLGGKETVCKKFYDLLSVDSKVEFVFIDDYKQGVGEVNDEWLGDASYTRITSKVSNTKVRRISFAAKIAILIRNKCPDIIVAIDPLSCYVSHMARAFSFRRPVLYSWIHLSLDALYKSKYVARADFHLAISSGIVKQLIDMGVSENRISLIYNSVARAGSFIPRPRDVVRFLYVGRLCEKDKKISEMLKALSSLSGEWELYVLGSGPDEEALKKLAVELQISQNVTWVGWKAQPWNYVRENIKEVSALLLTSRVEGFGMSLAEAMSYGVYCISSDCKYGPSDIIRPPINGVLYPPGREDILTERLQAIVDGEQVPDGEKIRDSIEHLYDDSYLARIKAAFKI
ncbi:glycosyltransferase [Hahella sp. CR1]|uniref:glycosyltransferase n=1 Tax=Hahella sp. CR1 TaxID=2992807 RepID=UPI0024429885|nr:glycosyltransferase [Hahella sp. CR1]MDG9669170.1 glycosyltransferase [Hahella sp. CR1]